MILISKKSTWSTRNWVNALLNWLNIMNWDLPKIIINDRNSKFFNEFWTTLFIKLKTRLFYNTTYHSQIDGQSEKINQTIEIALRYHLSMLNKLFDWLKILSTIQKNFNNSICFTKTTLNETIYDFISNQAMNLPKTFPDIIVNQTRREIADAITFSQINFKATYDNKHKPIQLRVGDWVLLRLHHEYNISFTTILRKKLSQQFVNSFKILKKIDRLIYKLKLSQNWRIHSIFIIAQLKSCSDFKSNPYHRSRSNNSPSIHVEEDINTMKSFVLNKIVIIKKSAKRKKYFVRWKDYESKKNSWRNLTKMKNAFDLIREYETTHFKKKSIKSTQSIKSRDRFKKT